ncbi:MAG: cytidylate kinase family protein [Thermodesulfobacteriota bacterium]
MISSNCQFGRQDLAASLSRKTGWPVLCREDMLDQVRELGIRIGRLEQSVIKTPGLSEKLALEKELYRAAITATLSQKALQGHLIYHGRSGHLLLPGVSHRLRVGLTVPWGLQVEHAQKDLNISVEKAETYLRRLDEDIHKWVRFMHRVDHRNPGHFDLILNLENISLANAAGIIQEMAELADFQPTAAGLQVLGDLNLAARARLCLAQDKRTAGSDYTVRADEGVLTVTYPPTGEDESHLIIEVLSDLEGRGPIQCTMAESNILWVQERFSPESENFQPILQMAQRFGAAVELLRLIPPGDSRSSPPPPRPEEGSGAPAVAAKTAYDGGIEDDDHEPVTDDGGLSRTQEELVDLGRFGGRRTVYGGGEQLLEAVQPNGEYSLVVIGDMFLSKGPSTQKRQTRELALTIRDRLKAPVITADELKSRFLFGRKQAFQLLGFLALVVGLYFLVFHYQNYILNFLGGSAHQKYKWLVSIGVILFTPLIAHIYGTVSGLVLKLINID